MVYRGLRLFHFNTGLYHIQHKQIIVSSFKSNLFYYYIEWKIIIINFIKISNNLNLNAHFYFFSKLPSLHGSHSIYPS